MNPIFWKEQGSQAGTVQATLLWFSRSVFERRKIQVVARNLNGHFLNRESCAANDLWRQGCKLMSLSGYSLCAVAGGVLWCCAGPAAALHRPRPVRGKSAGQLDLVTKRPRPRSAEHTTPLSAVGIFKVFYHSNSLCILWKGKYNCGIGSMSDLRFLWVTIFS